MNAFTIDAPRNDRYSRADGACQHYLPQVACEACGETWMDTEVWHPSLSLSIKADKTMFSRDRIVPPAQLTALQHFVRGRRRQTGRLLPGAGIGPVEVDLPKRATDFIWCGFKLLASKRAIDIMDQHGIKLSYGPVVTAGVAFEYVALELMPMLLYSEKTEKEMTLCYCTQCGSYEMRNFRAEPTGPREYIASRIPKGNGLVRDYGSPATLATDEFIKVARSAGLTGIEVSVFGVFV